MSVVWYLRRIQFLIEWMINKTKIIIYNPINIQSLDFTFYKNAFVCVLNASLMVCIIAEKYITHENRFIAGYVIFSAIAIEEIILSVKEYVCVSGFC